MLRKQVYQRRNPVAGKFIILLQRELQWAERVLAVSGISFAAAFEITTVLLCYGRFAVESRGYCTVGDMS